VVPFGAGGTTDVVARVLAPGLAKQLGQSVIVENKPGASGQLGTAAVKAASPDGLTLLLALDHSVVVVPLMTPSAEYDALRDFVAVGQVGSLPMDVCRSCQQSGQVLNRVRGRGSKSPHFG
jgi:tripartite-type tricarboxylate transporter receptor subunit TctC